MPMTREDWVAAIFTIAFLFALIQLIRALHDKDLDD